MQIRHQVLIWCKLLILISTYSVDISIDIIIFATQGHSAGKLQN